MEIKDLMNKCELEFSPSLQVRHPPSLETVRRVTIANLVHLRLRLSMDSLERSAQRDIIVSGALLLRKVVHLEHFPTH